MKNNHLIFATNNIHKLREVSEILNEWTILSLKDMNLFLDIPEDFQTIEENAIQKAVFVYDIIKKPVISDDSALYIEELDGRPGVISAFYAGVGCSQEDNILKVLQEMKDKKNRNAKFCTIAVFYDGLKPKFFKGELLGSIALAPRGNFGFGYDPIFIPTNYNTTIAQIPPSEKNRISHRAQAFRKLAKYLKLIKFV